MKLYLEDNWQDPKTLQDEFVNQMSNCRWQPAVEITITTLPVGNTLPVGSEVVVKPKHKEGDK